MLKSYAMIKATPFESIRQHRTDLPAELEADVRVPTLIVEHSDHSELLWALRLTEFFGDAGRQYSYQPDVQWNDDGCGMLSYANTPVAEAEANASGTCSCRVRSGEAGLTFEIDVTNQSSEIWPEFWGWLCLIHRWSRAFQANCELPVGESGNWVPASSLAAPLERWLKWCPVSGHAEAMQIGQNTGDQVAATHSSHSRRGACMANARRSPAVRSAELSKCHHPGLESLAVYGLGCPLRYARARADR